MSLLRQHSAIHPAVLAGVYTPAAAATWYLANPYPPDGATYVRGSELVEWDVLAVDPSGDPVRSSAIGATANGRPLALTKSVIAGGVHCSAVVARGRLTTYTLAVSADTISTAGAPTTQTFSFSTGPAAAPGVSRLDGLVRVLPPTRGCLDGTARRLTPNLARLEGAARPSPFRAPTVAILDGAAVARLRGATAATLEGLVTRLAVELGFPLTVLVGAAGIDVASGAVVVEGISTEADGAAIVVSGTQIERDGATVVVHVAKAEESDGGAIVAGPGAAEPASGAAVIDGAHTRGLVELRSESTAHREERERR